MTKLEAYLSLATESCYKLCIFQTKAGLLQNVGLRAVYRVAQLIKWQTSTNIKKICRLSNLLIRECQEGLIRSPVSLLTETSQQKNMGEEATI